MLHRRSLVLLATALLASTPTLASAETLIVDDTGGPGVDYTSLPAAVLAAQRGDLLVLRPGDYTGFTTGKDLRLMGPLVGSARVTTKIELVGLPAGSVFHLSRVSFSVELELTSCAGAVLIDRGGSSSFGRLYATGCADVRARNTSFGASWSSQPVYASSIGYLELVGVTATADDVGDCDSCSGADGMYIGSGSFAVVARSRFAGGDGGDCTTIGCYSAGEGGNGTQVWDSTLLLTGSPFWPQPDPLGPAWIRGGDGGEYFGGGDADGGDGLLVEDSFLRIWGVQLIGGTPGGQGLYDFGGSTVDLPTTPDPDLVLVAEPSAGSFPLSGQRSTRRTALVQVRGEPGSNIRLAVGREPIVQPHPTILVPRLVQVEQYLPIGEIGAGGTFDYELKVPVDRAVGDAVVLQADLVPPGGGTIRRTHSMHFMVR